MAPLIKVLLAYFLAFFIEILILVITLNRIDPQKYPLNTESLSHASLALMILAIPLSVLAFIAYGNTKRIVLQSIAKGLAIWLFISLIPLSATALLVDFLENGSYYYVFALIEILISGYIIQRYRLPRSFILLVLVSFLYIPSTLLAVLYLLIYGIIKQAKARKVS